MQLLASTAMGCHHHQLIVRRLALLAAALCVILATQEWGCFAAARAARPLIRRHGAAADEEEELVMDVSAASPEGASWGGGQGVVRAGKWLPLPSLPVVSGLAGGLHFPGGGVSMPWMAGAPPALAGPGVQLVQPYVGTTRQEQLSLWTSLFNPFQVRPRLPAAAAETTSPGPMDIPAVAGVAPEKTTTVNEPAGEPKWGVYLGNNNGNN